MLAKKRQKLGIGRWEFSLLPVERMLYPSLHKNPVTSGKKKQLKNKLDVLKKEYSMFMEFKNYATGLG